jgi:YrbI family 3-deoxy-D-manno-octulosonate 8-phosphate phosphatase
MEGMGYQTKLQVIERKNNTRQFYIVCPAPLAEALEMEKGEILEFVVEDKNRLTILRKLAVMRPQHSFERIKMIVLDFDGVFTDNRVYVTEKGKEMVACSRADGMGLEKLRDAGFEIIVISKEKNPVVAARCSKLKLPFRQGIQNKIGIFRKLVAEKKLRMEQVAYIGNDVNDLDCMLEAGLSVAVADSHPDILRIANLILSKPGGKGAIREFCDAFLANRK